MAMNSKQRSIKWTDADRIRLVEAVIKVEQETTNSSPNSAGGNSIKSAREKWDAIADLLPPQFGEKYWNPDRQTYIHPKCCGMFHNLLKTYRDKVGGKATRNSRLRLSVPLLEILKKREDLREGRCSVPDRSLSGLLPHVDTGRRQHHGRNLNQKQISPTGNSSLGMDEFRLNSGIGSGKKVKWTEAARLQVINAVIQVEMNYSGEGVCSGGNWKGKWNMIADLLPPGLRERVENSNRTLGEHKCCRVFYNLMSAYKSHLAAGKVFKGMLTKDVVQLLQRREELLNARVITEEKKKSLSCSRRSKGIRSQTRSYRASRKPWELVAAQKAYAHKEKSSLGQSTGLGRGTRTYSFSQKAAEPESEGSKKAPRNDGKLIGSLDTDHIDHDLESVDRQTSGCSLGSRKFSRFRSEFKDPVNKAGLDGSWSGVETRAQTRAKMRDCNSATSRPAGEPTTPRPKRQRTAAPSQTTYDEQLQTVLDRSLKQIDSEFPDLSSWLRSPATRDEFKSKVVLLASRRQVDDAWRRGVGEMIDTPSLSKMIDHQVRALFYKLRIRIAVELNSVCEEIAHEVAEAKQILHTSRHSAR